MRDHFERIVHIHTRRNIHTTRRACTSGFTCTYTRLLGQFGVEVHPSTSHSNQFNLLHHIPYEYFSFFFFFFTCLLQLLLLFLAWLFYTLNVCMLYTAFAVRRKLHRPQTKTTHTMRQTGNFGQNSFSSSRGEKGKMRRVEVNGNSDAHIFTQRFGSLVIKSKWVSILLLLKKIENAASYMLAFCPVLW